jgi:hypothetical protein
MLHKAFCKLVRILKPKLERDHLKGNRVLYINPYVVIVIGIRYLTGEPYTALNDIANISTTSVYMLKNRFISALLAAEDKLKIKLPEGVEEWERVHQGFDNIPSFGLFKNTVGAIDVFLLQPSNHVWMIVTIIQWLICLVIMGSLVSIVVRQFVMLENIFCFLVL